MKRLVTVFLLAMGLVASSVAAPVAAQAVTPPTVTLVGPSALVPTGWCQTVNFTASISGIAPGTSWYLTFGSGWSTFQSGKGPATVTVSSQHCDSSQTTRDESVTADFRVYGTDSALGSGFNSVHLYATTTVRFVAPTTSAISWIDYGGAAGKVDPALYVAGYAARVIYRADADRPWNALATVPLDSAGNWALVRNLSPGQYMLQFDGTPVVPGANSPIATLAPRTVKTTIKKLSEEGASGTVSPAVYGSGTKVVLYVRAVGSSTFKKVLTTKVSASGRWSSKKSLGAGKYYAQVVKSDAVASKRSAYKEIDRHTIRLSLKKSSTSRLEGVATPAKYSKGTKVVIYRKSVDGYRFQKFGSATVSADGHWVLNKKLKPGAYYVKASSSSTVSSRSVISRVAAPTPKTVPGNGATARCRDGSLSYSQHRQGTCSWHGGVAVWY